MLFNSPLYIWFFLPAAVASWLLARKFVPQYALHCVMLFSLAFYAMSGLESFVLLLASTAVNYLIFRRIVPAKSRLLLTVGVGFNLLLLCWFKYAIFLATNLSIASIASLNIILPIGISFYTFQQIAILVDRHRGIITPHGVVEYLLSVTYFPHLIAGPIIHYRQVIPQFLALRHAPGPEVAHDIAIGSLLFAIGLFKKVVIADTFAADANAIYGNLGAIGFWTAWKAALCYSLQIYFDFSGYVDMAIGAGRMFGIRLPINFLSPYKSENLIEFWRRWHITLSNFLRDYLYIPLGGSRYGFPLQMRNLLVTMLLGGLWHGAAWGYIVWGALHGLGLAACHLVSRYAAWVRFPKPLAVVATFLAVTILWVPFRMEALNSTLKVWKAMSDFPTGLRELLAWLTQVQLPADAFPAILYDRLNLFMALAMFIVWFAPNSHQIADWAQERLENPWVPSVAGFLVGSIFAMGVMVMNSGRVSPFLYFQF